MKIITIIMRIKSMNMKVIISKKIHFPVIPAKTNKIDYLLMKKLTKMKKMKKLIKMKNMKKKIKNQIPLDFLPVSPVPEEMGVLGDPGVRSLRDLGIQEEVVVHLLNLILGMYSRIYVCM